MKHAYLEIYGYGNDEAMTSNTISLQNINGEYLKIQRKPVTIIVLFLCKPSFSFVWPFW